MINFILGLVLSIIYSILFLPNKEGAFPTLKPTFYPIFYKGLIIIPITNQKALHIHHWIIFLMIGYLFLIKKNYFIFSFCLGLIFQGLSYKDAFEIICKNPYN